MFIVTEYNNLNYKVLDTDDSVEEVFTSTELSNIINSGVQVIGYSNYGVPQNVYLRFILSSSEVYYYNGYFVYDNISGDLARTQVITFNGNLELLKRVIPYIRKFNNKDINTNFNQGLVSFNFGYKVDSIVDNVYFNITDIRTNEVFSSSFLEVMSIFYTEKLLIEGISYINEHEIKVLDKMYSLDTQLDYFCTKTINNSDTVVRDVCNSVNPYSEDGIDELFVTRATIDSFIPANSFIITKDLFPLYNIYGNVLESGFDIPLGLIDNIVDISNRDIIFRSGRTLPVRDGYHLIDSISNTTLRDNLEKIYNSDLGKSALLNGNVDSIKKTRERSVTLDGLYNMWTPKCTEIRYLSELTTNPDLVKGDNKFITTPYGNIVIDWKREYICYRETDKRERISYVSYINGVFGVRVTNLGCYWYDLCNNKVVCTAPKNVATFSLSGEYITYAVNHMFGDDYDAFSYHTAIYPLCLKGISLEDDGINIIMTCMLKEKDTLKDTDWADYGISFVDIPLIFLGSQVSYYNGVYKINTVAQDIYLTEGVFNNLCGCYYFDDLVQDFDSRNIKLYRNLKKWHSRYLKASLGAANKLYGG